MISTRWIWVRHAPVDTAGRLIGRTELPATFPDMRKVAFAARQAGGAARMLSSPMQRALMTAERMRAENPRLPLPQPVAGLEEQDFGDWDGRAYAEVEALAGPVPGGPAGMANLTGRGGETFSMVVERVQQVMKSLSIRLEGETIAVVAHAGVIRAALVLALGLPAWRGLAFQIDHLSATVLTDHGAQGWAVERVNYSGPE